MVVLMNLCVETAQRNLAKEENAPDLKEEEENLKKKLLKHAMKRAGLMQTLLVCLVLMQLFI